MRRKAEKASLVHHFLILLFFCLFFPCGFLKIVLILIMLFFSFSFSFFLFLFFSFLFFFFFTYGWFNCSRKEFDIHETRNARRETHDAYEEALQIFFFCVLFVLYFFLFSFYCSSQVISRERERGKPRESHSHYSTYQLYRYPVCFSFKKSRARNIQYILLINITIKGF